MEDEPKTKVCTRCGQELPVEYFNKNNRTKDGLQIYCKDCQKAMMKISRERRKQLKIAKVDECVEMEDGRKITWDKKAEARECLAVLPDSELLTELRRRGYIGKIYKKIEVVL